MARVAASPPQAAATMVNMTTLHIEIGPLRFRGLSDVLFEEHLAKSLFFDALVDPRRGYGAVVWLREWQAAAELARLVEESLGIRRDGIGH